MKISEKVIRYVEGEMKSSEREDFEKELQNSLQIKNELDTYIKLKSGIEAVKDIPLEETYFTSIIPRFRLSREKLKRSKLITRFAFGATAVTAVILFFLLVNQPDINETDENLVSDFLIEEADSLFFSYPNYYVSYDSLLNENYSEEINDMLVTALNISSENLDKISVYDTYQGYNQNIVNNISDEEADLIYNEIINKRFF